MKFKVMESKTKNSVIALEEVSRKFNIGIDRAKDMLRVTEQKGIRYAVNLLYHIYRLDNKHLNRKRLNAQIYTDKILAKTKSLEGNTGSWIYTTRKLTVLYPCIKRLEVGDTLRWFVDDVGIPDILRSDMAPETTGKHTEFQAQLKHLRIELTHF